MADDNSLASADADIAAFIAEGHVPDDGGNVSDGSDAPEGDNAEVDPQGSVDEAGSAEDHDSDSADESEESDDAAPAPSTVKVDTKALIAALEKKDPVAFIEALGSAADDVLTSKAHKVLRLQVKEVKKAEDAAAAAQTQAADLTNKLAAKYGDPIAARKAAENGDVDSFIDLVEKWAGNDWNAVQRWVAQGIAGRPQRLEAKQREAAKTATTQTVEQAKALDETRTWVGSSLKKADAKIMTECPEVVDMVIAEIKSGLAKGIDSPAKALPLVKAKLKEQHDRLVKYFAPAGKTTKAPAPAARVGKRDANTTRELSIEEEIAAFKKENGLK